jgi:TetR/AcrR family transcriptional regulator, transcriptional repressor for nem operon
VKVSREQMAQNRSRILDAAGQLFRERGFDSVSIADVMKAAGLTHGGFYGHFKSKDELFAQAIATAFDAGAAPAGDLSAYAKRYLTEAHCRNLPGGCPTAGLAAETIRHDGGARCAMTEGLSAQIDRLAAIAPGRTASDKRRAAIGSWAAMVGALILARASDDPKLSAELLGATQHWIAAGGGRHSS